MYRQQPQQRSQVVTDEIVDTELHFPPLINEMPPKETPAVGKGFAILRSSPFMTLHSTAYSLRLCFIAELQTVIIKGSSQALPDTMLQLFATLSYCHSENSYARCCPGRSQPARMSSDIIHRQKSESPRES